jgi:hypothetical protein
MAKKKPEKSDRQSFQWRTFLKQVSRDLLKDVRIREDLPHDVVESVWLGYEGASEEEIDALEKRLGKRLPLSYRSFLAETNGWRQWGPFIYKLWPCSEVCWFRERNQEWIDAYVHPENNGIQIVYPEGQSPPEPRPVTDDEYFVYGKEQNSCRFRTEYLQSALEISDVGDSAILLLNPEVVNEEGEWEAWLFANWMPGAHRYRSFRELMEEEHESFRRFQKEMGPGKSKYGNAGQQAARKGEPGKALAMLRQLAANGEDSSAASLAELCAFRGLWDEVITNLGRVIRNLGAIPNFNGYPGHLFRLLGRAGHETGQWKQISELAAAAIAAEEEREYDQWHEDVREAFIAWFKNLQAYCKRCGRPPHELIHIFGMTDSVDDLTEAERRQEYDSAVERDTTRLSKKPVELTVHLFAVARNMKLDDEMLRIYEKTPDAIYFNDALDVSRAYVRRGDAEAAWAVLRGRLHQSVGGLPEQVAPIILLIDDTLRPLMTRERCELVLSTPRGWEGTKK